LSQQARQEPTAPKVNRLAIQFKVIFDKRLRIDAAQATPAGEGGLTNRPRSSLPFKLLSSGALAFGIESRLDPGEPGPHRVLSAPSAQSVVYDVLSAEALAKVDALHDFLSAIGPATADACRPLDPCRKFMAGQDRRGKPMLTPSLRSEFSVRVFRIFRGSTPRFPSLIRRVVRLFAEHQHKYLAMNSLQRKKSATRSSPIKPNQGILCPPLRHPIRQPVAPPAISPESVRGSPFADAFPL
jgi:hypothetical protein